MKNNFSKSETEKIVKEFFKNIKNKTPKDIKKIKKIAMHKNIPLKENKKLFCKKCLNPYKNSKIRIKRDKLIIICEKCNYISRWKIKKFEKN
jgi:RNase P subunit RPR2